MKIRDLYSAILEAVGAVVNEDDLISITRPEDEPVPLMVNDKRLAMPTDRLLNQGAFNEGTGLIAFHPICENVVLETSPVLEKLQTAMTFRLTWVMSELMRQLVAVAADPKLHKTMKIGAHGLLSALPDADDRTRNDFHKVIDSTSAMGAKKLLTLYIRKGASYEGAKVNRLGRFYPSIVDGLDQEKRTLYGVNLRKADVPAFLALMEYLLPEYKDADRYSAPSNSLVAPSFHALVKTYYKVANQLNKIIDIHADHLDQPDVLRIRTDWIEDVQDLSGYREKIPVLPGNDGAEGTKQQRSIQSPSAAPSGPAAAKAPAATSPGGRSVQDVLQALQGQTQPQGGRFQGGNRWGGGQAAQPGRPDPMDLPPWARPKEETPTRWGQQAAAPRGGSWGGDRGRGGGRL